MGDLEPALMAALAGAAVGFFGSLAVAFVQGRRSERTRLRERRERAMESAYRSADRLYRLAHEAMINAQQHHALPTPWTLHAQASQLSATIELDLPELHVRLIELIDAAEQAYTAAADYHRAGTKTPDALSPAHANLDAARTALLDVIKAAYPRTSDKTLNKLSHTGAPNEDPKHGV